METYLLRIAAAAARLEQASEWYFYKRIRHKSFQRLNYPANIAIFVHVIIHNK